ncbi:glutamine amidotransferase [Candidatus Saccharibacteria bacterium RIFCSPHIGHO2_12_FULL_41_12]|nr:MAG: glutamine amidotransferase [Candidatus Saccharibacteria bacterium RIFCSPHIGHO2_12_FULL_41_12]
MSKVAVRLLQLYPREMNIYGDWGNALTLKKRLQWRGYEVELLEHRPGQAFPKDVDLIVGGGGQDSGQEKIRDDLLKIGDELHKLADSGIPMLMICGMYQLFGRFFETVEGDKIEGISIFGAQTVAGPKRLIGNIVTESAQFGEIIGYENHSGLTILDDTQPALAHVVKGAGNNGKDHLEGAIYKNVIGSYLHGSLLPKNPRLADWLIEKAVVNKFGEFDPKPINDDLAIQARKTAISLKR